MTKLRTRKREEEMSDDTSTLSEDDDVSVN